MRDDLVTGVQTCALPISSDTRDILHAELAKNNVRSIIYIILYSSIDFAEKTYILMVFYNFISAASVYICFMSGFTA